MRTDTSSENRENMVRVKQENNMNTNNQTFNIKVTDTIFAVSKPGRTRSNEVRHAKQH